jgi:hypothetical protein
MHNRQPAANLQRQLERMREGHPAGLGKIRRMKNALQIQL